MNILDTTLRDGSYAVDFSFTFPDVRNICNGLEEAGIKFIEIGHGIGLGVERSSYKSALHTNLEYLAAAKEATKNVKIGMFCIPGIADICDIDSAAAAGLDFVRIGTSVDEVETSKRFIEQGKRHGMTVMANYMKSYTSSPQSFAEKAKLSAGYGADCVYIVDSSGGMFPEQLEAYADAVRSVCPISLGFHGHNNLGISVFNSIRAAELGFEYIDVSLQGLGRSSGNAPAEQLVACLQKKGMAGDIDLLKLMACGYEHVNQLIEKKGVIPIDTISGLADFHTSYMPIIHKYSSQYSVDPLMLIIELTKIDKLTATDEMVSNIAKKLPQAKYDINKYGLRHYAGGEQNYNDNISRHL